jgi:hypothetical protein
VFDESSAPDIDGRDARDPVAGDRVSARRGTIFPRR